jgi:hypothetical protein
MSQVQGCFLMTYDDVSEVVHMAEKRGFIISRVLMKNAHHLKLYELLITGRKPRRLSTY